MATIRPFKGLVYNAAKAGDLNKVMAPPYDVISPAYKEELHKRHPNNIIRLILGKEEPGDKPGSDWYSRAAAELKKWRDEGVLTRDTKPAYYYYSQTYKGKDGKLRTRKGFIGLTKIEEPGKGSVHPHEKTLSCPKADRLNLMKACDSNLSCIFMLYPEGRNTAPEKRVNTILDNASKGAAPIVDVKDDDGVGSRLWRIDDEASVAALTEAIADKPLFIADGHHRYETALNYRNFRREQTKSASGSEIFNYVMSYFTSMEDEGLDIFPTHRVVHSLENFDVKTLVEKCREFFEVEELKFSDAGDKGARAEFFKKIAATEDKRARFGIYARGGGSRYVLTIKSADTMEKVFGSTIPDVYKTLDVTILHSLILNKILGISQEAQEKQKNLVYVKDLNLALDEAEKGANQVVFIMNPTKVEEVKAVSEAGLLMPQKSTYFYPKLLSGPVINPLSD